ncbi:MAG: tRNA pseudouridine(38-40) synthase TruA [Nitratireductor sp.]
MPRYKLTIEYDGTNYKGWQKQDGLPSVQQSVEEALAHFTQHTCTLITAGRTDAGVHALGQVAHVDLQETWREAKILQAANGILKLNNHPISVLKVEKVQDDFNARFSALKRHYRYRIINRFSNLTVDKNRCWHVRPHLDVEAMNEAAKVLIGRHDFTTFRSTDCQAKSPLRSIDQLDVRLVEHSSYYPAEIEVITSARAFLHNQVRSLVGSLKLVGEGKWSEKDLKNALEAKDRNACGPVAPSCGLYFMKADYPPAFTSKS